MLRAVKIVLTLLLVVLLGISEAPILSSEARAAQVDLIQQFDAYLQGSYASPVLTREAAEELATFFMMQTKNGKREAGLNALRDLKEELLVYGSLHPNDKKLGFKLRSFSETLTVRLEKMKDRRGWQGGLFTLGTSAGSMTLYIQNIESHLSSGDDVFFTVVVLFFGLMAGYIPTLAVTQGRGEVIEALNEFNKPYISCQFLLAEGL